MNMKLALLGQDVQDIRVMKIIFYFPVSRVGAYFFYLYLFNEQTSETELWLFAKLTKAYIVAGRQT